MFRPDRRGASSRFARGDQTGPSPPTWPASETGLCEEINRQASGKGLPGPGEGLATRAAGRRRRRDRPAGTGAGQGGREVVGRGALRRPTFGPACCSLRSQPAPSRKASTWVAAPWRAAARETFSSSATTRRGSTSGAPASAARRTMRAAPSPRVRWKGSPARERRPARSISEAGRCSHHVRRERICSEGAASCPAKYGCTTRCELRLFQLR